MTIYNERKIMSDINLKITSDAELTPRDINIIVLEVEQAINNHMPIPHTFTSESGNAIAVVRFHFRDLDAKRKNEMKLEEKRKELLRQRIQLLPQICQELYDFYSKDDPKSVEIMKHIDKILCDARKHLLEKLYKE